MIHIRLFGTRKQWHRYREDLSTKILNNAPEARTSIKDLITSLLTKVYRNKVGIF